MNTFTQQQSVEAPINMPPLFKPFEWVPGQAQRGPFDLLSDVHDIASGIGLVLQMVERSQILADSGAAPLIDTFDAGRLTRLAIASMRCVEGRIHNYFQHMGDPEHPGALEQERTSTK